MASRFSFDNRNSCDNISREIALAIGCVGCGKRLREGDTIRWTADNWNDWLAYCPACWEVTFPVKGRRKK